MGYDVDGILKRIRAQRFDDENPRCPHADCGERISFADPYGDGEMMCRHTTYHGEDGPKPDECPHCGKRIYIRESVRRSWTIATTEKGTYD